MLNVVVIGSVGSTAVTLQKLVEHGFDVKGVLGYEPENVTTTSGWYNLRELSATLNVEFRPFKKINDNGHLEWARQKNIDIIFAVGFSQLLSDDWLQLPRLGCIGFHPTLLPKGRGRAPLAWIVLEERQGAANFFLMGKGADDGPIFIQSPFSLSEEDDAGSVRDILLFHIAKALDEWLPKLSGGEWMPIPQDESEASYYGKRNQEDGLIHWELPANKIDLLIKASTHPHPGGFTFFKEQKIIIFKSKVEKLLKFRGVTGRVLMVRKTEMDLEYLVQCGEGLIWIYYLEPGSLVLKVGDTLGYDPGLEIASLKNEVRQLKQQLEAIINKMNNENTGDSSSS